VYLNNEETRSVLHRTIWMAVCSAESRKKDINTAIVTVLHTVLLPG